MQMTWRKPFTASNALQHFFAYLLRAVKTHAARFNDHGQ
jgi:hypothetical protein